MQKQTKGACTKKELYIVQAGRCFYCCEKMAPGTHDPARRPNGYTRDHFMPKCDGTHGFENIVLSCRDCNSRKSDRRPSKKALFKFELLLTVRKQFPRIHIGKAKKLAAWKLPYF